MLLPSSYSMLGYQMNSLLDQGASLDIDQTRQHIADGSLFTWLEAEFGGRVDLGLFDPDDRAAVCEAFRDYVLTGRTRRYYLVESNGLALLVAYSIQSLQLAVSELSEELAAIHLRQAGLTG
jgi:hypothetical protein